MSYKAEVIADDSGKWASNALRFPTEEEAQEYAKDLYTRWALVREWRVVRSHDTATHRFHDGAPKRIDAENEVQTGTLYPDGTLTNVRVIKQADMMRCPHYIITPDHYRDDGTCRCDDPEYKEMAEWGYTWRTGQWR